MSVSQPSVDRQPRQRSAVSNGARLLPDCDHRSARMRRMRDLIVAHVDDLGGQDAISEAERSICRRIATLTVELEVLESKFAEQGEATAKQLDLYQRTSGNLRRLLESIGLKRRPRNVTPERTLAQFIEQKLAERT